VNAEKLIEIRDKCKRVIDDMPLELLAEVWMALQQIKALGRKDIPPVPPGRKIQ